MTIQDPPRRAVLAGGAALAVTGGWRMAQAEEGLDAAALHAMDRALAAHVDPGAGLTGMVTLVARGADVHVTELGPMRRDTIFRITSMTKPLAAAVTMQLAEDGLLALDEPVARLLPEFAAPRVLARPGAPLDETVPAARPILVADLLTMRMGTGAIFAPPEENPLAAAMIEAGVAPGPRLPAFPDGDAYAAALAALPLARQPGTAWLYDTPMQLLGVLLERAADMPLPDLMRARLFAPLGMADTGFHVPAEKLGRLPACHWRNYRTGVLEVFDPPGTGSAFARPPGFASAAGGLVSTADDWLAFARMMLAGGVHDGRPLLAPASVAAMTRDHVTPAQKAVSSFGPGFWDAGGWGYGLQVIANTAPGGPAGCGWVGGTGTSGYWDPSSGLVGIHLTQRVMDSPAPTPVFSDFWRGARAAAGA